MTPQIFFARIETLLAIAFFVWFAYGRWQQLVIDVTRHELFKIRHRIFLMAADKKLDFNSAAYKELRETFNGLIRFCHVMTAPKMVAIYATRRYNAPQRMRMTELLGKFENTGTRQIIESEWRKAADFVSLSMLLRSPILLFVLVIATPLLPLLSVVLILNRQRVRKSYRSMIRNTVERGIELEVCHSQPAPTYA
jgi:hypothetical protein